MHLEKITESNLNEAVEIAKLVFPYESHADGFWPEVAYKMAIEEQNERFAYYIAKNNGISLGITGHYPPDDNNPNNVWLGWFGIIPAMRRRGFGSILFLKTTTLLANFGMTTLNLYSGDREEERPAHEFYKKFGLKETHRGDVDGSPVIYFSGPILT